MRLWAVNSVDLDAVAFRKLKIWIQLISQFSDQKKRSLSVPMHHAKRPSSFQNRMVPSSCGIPGSTPISRDRSIFDNIN